jgi:hypothetical protein
MHLQSGPGLLGIPLESFEVGRLKLVVGLYESVEFCACGCRSYLLLELLVDGVESVLDGDSFQVPRSDFET